MAAPQSDLPDGTPFWDRLSQDDRGALSQASTEKTFAPGTCVCKEGEEASFALVILTGWVKVLKTSATGRPQVEALRTRGDLVGESAKAEGCRRMSTLIAATEVEGLVVTSEALRHLLRASEGADNAFSHVQHDKQMESDRLRMQMGVTSVDERLAHALVSMADRSGTNPADGHLTMEPPLTQEELAQLVRAARSGVESALRKWRKRKAVKTGRQSITLIDIHYLRRLAAR